MTNDLVRQALSDGCFGDHLNERCREAIAAISRLVEYPPGQLIFRYGEPGLAAYVIVKGLVSIEVSSPAGCKQSLTVGEGELLGWTPVLRMEQRIASARTLRPTKVVEIDVARLHPLFESDAQLAYDFMRATVFAVARRLDAARLQLANVYYTSLPAGCAS